MIVATFVFNDSLVLYISRFLYRRADVFGVRKNIASILKFDSFYVTLFF